MYGLQHLRTCYNPQDPPNVKSNVSFTVKNVLILCYLLFKTRTCVQIAVKNFSEVANETQITSLGPYERET